MKYLTLEEILFMHHRILVELQPINDDFTIRDPGGLMSAIARPQQSAGGEDGYKDIYSKAAALTESLIGNHCFQDGNKRIGISAGIVFMLNNGFKISASEDDVFEIAMNVSNGLRKFEEIKNWYEAHFN